MSEAPPVAILVVDDSSFNRLLLTRRLKELGFADITTANDGVQALAAMAARPFDVVLLDLEMPELDGIGVLEAMRAAPAPQPPVIVISALTDMANIVRCIELGAEDYLPKSFDPPLLRARLGAILEKKRLADLAAERLAALEAELDSARNAQLALVPRDFAAFAGGGVVLYAAMIPARQVGGDLYDVMLLDARHLLVVVADVSGKGAPAGLTMARTLGLMRASARLLAAGGAVPDPGEILTRANADLALDNEEMTFVTVALAVLDRATGTGRIANAGHEPPLLFGPAGVEVLGGLRRQPPLGVVEEMVFGSDAFALPAGMGMLLVSDGVTEAEDGQGGFYGRDRLQAALDTVRGAAPEAVIAALLGAVEGFVAGAPQADDITLLALRFAG